MKKLMVFILLFMTIIIMANQVMAFGLDDIVQRGDDFINKGDPSDAISEKLEQHLRVYLEHY